MPEPHGHPGPPWGDGPPWGRGGPPWGGSGDRPWGGEGPGRRFRRGAVAVVAIVVVLVSMLATLVARIVTGNPPPRWITVVVAAVVVAGLVASARALWRSARTVGSLMDAADRVAHGEYATRVPDASSRQLGRLTVAFNEMAERLETNERRRRELLGDIAHELRTPLQVLRGSVEGMLDGLYPIEPKRLEALLDETLVMSRLLDDLRTLSMAEEGVLQLHPESVDPRALAEDAVRSFEAAAAAADVTVQVEAGGPVAPLDADPVRVGEVLANLLANAIRHTPAGGRVDVRVRDTSDAVSFEVADTGPGIATEQLDRVFDRFVRSDTGGTGLGLAIAKRLVQAHGGTIEAAGRPGGGTAIRFTIPR